MYDVNVVGTANVVNMALEKNVRRFIHISSVAALGRKTNGAHVNEEKKWEENKFNTHYAISKYRSELEVWRGIAEGLNGIIVNPSTVIGYGDCGRTLGHNQPTVAPEWGVTAMPLYLNNRASTIYAGSNEIQRNILAKAILGL